MAAFVGLSPAQVVLEAVRLTINVDISALQQLTAHRSDILKIEFYLRILLTYLPEGTEPSLYIDFLHRVSHSLSQGFSTTNYSNSYPQTFGSFHKSSEQDISEHEARHRVKRLHLAPLKDPHAYYEQDADPLTLFLLCQAHKIDAETGSLDLVRQLVEPFIQHSELLRGWAISYLLPLLRLDYEYYSHSGPSHSLADFERLEGGLAIQELLSKGVQRKDPGDIQDIGRDLKGLVGPWMYGESTRKRRRLNSRRRKTSISVVAKDDETTDDGQVGSGWSHVNDWLLELSLRDFRKSVDILQKWTGPREIDYGDWIGDTQPLNEEQLRSATYTYAQAGLAAIYTTNELATHEDDLKTVMGSHRILLNVARLVDVDEPPSLTTTGDAITSGISRDFLNSLSPTHLLHNALLRSGNPLTTPTKSSIMLTNLLLFSSYKLTKFRNFKSSKSLAELSLFASEDEQRAELRKTLFTLKSDPSIEEEKVWPSIRRQILWLRHWELQQGTEDEPRGVFGRIAKAEVEKELLRAMLDGRAYSTVVDVYCNAQSSPLPMATVESTILSTALSSYDAASSCSSRDPSLKASYEIIREFGDYFSNSKQLAQIKALQSATKAISSYELTLQRGIPLRPVNIRANKDPVALIGRVLSQSQGSYRHLDPFLLRIGNDLVTARLTHQALEPTSPSPPQVNLDQEMITTRRRVTKMAIEAALEADDFDTAYSNIMAGPLSASLTRTQESENKGILLETDDISWRAVYQAGRYPITASTTLQKVEQRLELLSQALLLAPPAALSEVLEVWQQYEQAMMVHVSREAKEEANWDEKGDRKVPGGFAADSSPVIQKARDPSRNALVEEAPIGLFDVARGAAAALSKNAFPLRGVQKGEAPADRTSQGRPLSTASLGSSDEGDINGAGGQGRVRKRDMVSSMVTGGLASGIGWVIGAPSVRQE